MGGRTAGSKDVAPKIRGAFKRACKVLDGKGDDFSGLTELLVDSLKDDVLATLGAISKFVPREIEIDAEVIAKEKTRAELESKLSEAGIDLSLFDA